MALFAFAGCADNSGENGGNTESPAANTGFASAEEAIAYIEKIYAACPQENLPMMLMHNELDLSDMDTVTYNTGLTDVSGISHIIVSESAVGSIPYSMIYVMTEDGADTAAIMDTLVENVPVNKWVCVCADTVWAVQMGKDILLIMGEKDMITPIYDNAVELAGEEGVFNMIGDKVEK